MKARSEVKSKIAPINSSVLGTFTGKCCDSNVFNNNDMHLGREVFEKLIASEDFKRAMENHHYIGFLGHPDDIDCQEYEHACIVMKDMRILDNGEIEGDFDLIDTPVGRVVKSFIDAGVKFGISIRGCGEVDTDGEVDPDEFIFRGFDLVTFPAYDDCIPEFKAIAASTDTKKKAKYQKVCATIDKNLSSITSCSALEIIKDQLEDGCDEFNKVNNRIDELNAACPSTIVTDECDSVCNQRLEAVTQLYLDAAARVRELEQQLAELQVSNSDLIIECKTMKHRETRLNRIVANQIETANADIEDLEAECDDTNRQLDEKEDELKEVKASLAQTKQSLRNITAELRSTKESYKKQVTANTNLQQQLDSIIEKRKDDHRAIKASNDLNLKYKKEIEANSEALSDRDSTIEDLKRKLNETVVASERLESEASNLDDRNEELLSRVEAAEEMVSSYQQAYANLYANALGVYLTGLPITASTSVEELTDMIKAGTSTANIPCNVEVYSDDNEDDDDDIDDFDTSSYTAGLVTL